MPDILQTINAAPDITPNDKYYWGYQFQLGRDVLVPYVRQHGGFKNGDAVVEIGAAEGGVLMAFKEAGAGLTAGTDIATYRIGIGQQISDKLGLGIEFSEHDILGAEPKGHWRNAFDLAILRDVIEHLDDAELAIRNIRKVLKPGGHLLVTFPPYNSPYGGHQHILKNALGKLPYVHLLPEPLFSAVVNSGDAHEVDIEEVHRLKRIRLSAGKFLKAARAAGYDIVREDYYLLRPVFKMKFGLPAIPLTPLKSIPGVKEILALEATYLLKMK
jgi:SAM-dependent methyltransferase